MANQRPQTIQSASDSDLSAARLGLSDRLRVFATHMLRIVGHDETAPENLTDEFINEPLLRSSSTAHPKTLHNYALESREHWWLSLELEKQQVYRDLLINLRNFAFFNQTRHGHAYHTRLPAVEDDFHGGNDGKWHNVWLVCRPYGSIVEAFRHWSVLTQGRSISLTVAQAEHAEKRRANQNLSQTGFIKQLLSDDEASAHVDLEWKDLSSSSTDDYQDLYDRPRLTKLVAYHVGCTTYSAFEVCEVAGSIVTNMQAQRSYHLDENNSQHFAISLIRHIVMTQRRELVLSGTILEIADWDRGRDGLELKQWLTPVKKGLLFLTSSVTNSKTDDSSTNQPGYIKSNTLTHWLKSEMFKKSFLEAPLKVLAHEHRAAEAMRQYREHSEDYAATFHIVSQKVAAFMQLVLWSKTWLSKGSGLKARVPWVRYAAPAMMASSDIGSGLSSWGKFGLYLFLFICRTLYARGTAKPVCYDIKRIGPQSESPPSSSDEDSDSGGSGSGPDGGDGGYSAEEIRMLEDPAPERFMDSVFNRAEEMFSPEWLDPHEQGRAPAFTVTPASGNDTFLQGTLTPEFWSRSGVSTPTASRMSSSTAWPSEGISRRASAPALDLVRPSSAEPVPSKARDRYAPSDNLLRPSSSRSNEIKQHWSQLQQWPTPDEDTSESSAIYLSSLTLQDEPGIYAREPILSSENRSLSCDFERPWLSLQQMLPSSHQSRLGSYRPPAPTLRLAPPPSDQQRASSQPPQITTTDMIPLEDKEPEDEQVMSSLAHPSSFHQSRRLYDTRSRSWQSRPRPWTANSPFPRQRSRSYHVALNPTDLETNQQDSDDLEPSSAQLSDFLPAPVEMSRSRSS